MKRVLWFLGLFAVVCPALAGEGEYTGSGAALIGDLPPEENGRFDWPEHPSSARKIVGGVGFYLVKPIFGSNPAYYSSQTVTPPPGSTSYTSSGVIDFSWGAKVAPRFWLGYQASEDWTFRGQYWHFDNSSETIQLTHAADGPGALTTIGTVGVVPFTSTPLATGSPADAITIGSSLAFNVADLEAVRKGQIGCWDLQGSVGIRYVDLTQNYNASLTNAGDPNAQIAARTNLQSEHNVFHGFGPVLGGRASYPVGWGLSTYGDARGSVVFGTATQSGAQLFSGGAPQTQFFNYSSDRTIALPIGELELGVSWALQTDQCLWTVSTGFMSQVWYNAGAAAIGAGGTSVQSSAFSGNVLPVGGSLSTASNSSMYLVGWTLALGVAF
ncbi:MAG: hypothetical protein JSS02_28010 [Planctomycetes bacterium]|nr:hypothetical protein [Planctomycetota bacterium]